MFFPQIEETFIAEVQEMLPASLATSRTRLWPFIEQAERKYILPLLEADLYADLQKFYNNRNNWGSGSGDDVTKTATLVRLIQIAEINLAYLLGFDLLNSIISDSGFQRPGDQSNFKGLYKYQETNLKEYFSSTGFNGLDDVLKYLEANIEHFPEWEETTNFTVRKTSIIKDTETFDRICFINGSRLTFLRLQRFMNEVIDFDIKPLLGAEWNILMGELAKDEPAAKYYALVAEIQRPLAFLCVAKLIEKTGTLTDRGLFFEGKNSMFPDDSFKRPAEGDAAAVAAGSYKETGNKYLEALRQYLIKNSFIQNGSKDGSVFNRDNTGKSIFVA